MAYLNVDVTPTRVGRDKAVRMQLMYILLYFGLHAIVHTIFNSWVCTRHIQFLGVYTPYSIPGCVHA